MESNKNMGLLSIILGLIFIIFPMISEAVISIIIGLSLLFFGISAVYTGWDMKKYANNMYILSYRIYTDYTRHNRIFIKNEWIFHVFINIDFCHGNHLNCTCGICMGSTNLYCNNYRNHISH